MLFPVHDFAICICVCVCVHVCVHVCVRGERWVRGESGMRGQEGVAGIRGGAYPVVSQNKMEESLDVGEQYNCLPSCRW